MDGGGAAASLGITLQRSHSRNENNFLDFLRKVFYGRIIQFLPEDTCSTKQKPQQLLRPC